MSNAKNLCILATTRNAVKSSVGTILLPTASLNDNFQVTERTRLIISDGCDRSVAVYIDPRIQSLVRKVRAVGGTIKAEPGTAWQLGKFGIYLSPDLIVSRGQFAPGKLEST